MIRHETEKRNVAETGHEYGCFEQVAEELVEAGIAETGEWDEILERKGFRELIDVFIEIVTEDVRRCSCSKALTPEELEAERNAFTE